MGHHVPEVALSHSIFKLSAALGGVVCIQCFAAAMAQEPAVSSVNGKIELGGGVSSKTGGAYRIGGSVAAPLGDAFGIQGDLSLQNLGGLSGAGAIHLFTRDPESYLLGATAGVVRSGTATLSALGPEAELYLGRFSIEAWAGVANLDYDALAAVDKTGIFAMADIGFYATDDLRLSVGGSSVLGYEALNLGLEYQVISFETPLSVTADARFGEDGNITAMAGLKFYFGAGDKPLIDRHRQDDPPDRGMDLFGAAGTQVTQTGVPGRVAMASDFHNQVDCENAGFTWVVVEGPDYCA
jgi:hypothetical protein